MERKWNIFIGYSHRREHLIMAKVSLAVSQKKKGKQGRGWACWLPIYWTPSPSLLSISPRMLKQLSPRNNIMHLHLQHAKHLSNTTASSRAPLCKKKKKKEGNIGSPIGRGRGCSWGLFLLGLIYMHESVGEERGAGDRYVPASDRIGSRLRIIIAGGKAYHSLWVQMKYQHQKMPGLRVGSTNCSRLDRSMAETCVGPRTPHWSVGMISTESPVEHLPHDF